MTDFLDWVLRLSKPDMAAALLGLPAGAAMDVWLFPGGTLDPFNTGLYFAAGAIGAKYAVQSLRESWRKSRESPKSGSQDIESRFKALIGALDQAFRDARDAADSKGQYQLAKAQLETEHELWMAGLLSDVEMSSEIAQGVRRYRALKSPARSGTLADPEGAAEAAAAAVEDEGLWLPRPTKAE